MAVLLNYVWLTFGSLYMTNTNKQPEKVCGSITTAEDGLVLAARPAAETWNRGNKRSVSVMVDSGASGHPFDKCRFTGLRYKLENYQELAIHGWITTAGGHQLKEAGQGLRRRHFIGIQGFKCVTQLLVLAGPDIGRDFFSVEQYGALPGGESLAGIGSKPRGAICITWGSVFS